MYIHFCGCCRSKRIRKERGMLVLTSKGRLGFWHTTMRGHQDSHCCCCIRGSRQVHSCTNINWFHISDLCHTHHHHQIKTWNKFIFFWKKNYWESSLRLFFGVFPEQAMIDGYNTATVVPKIVTTDTGLIPEEISKFFSVYGYYRNLLKSLRGLITKTSAAIGLSEISRATMIEIVTEKDDTLHFNAQESRRELVEIQKAILDMKQAEPINWQKQHPENFQFVTGHVSMTILGEQNQANLDLNIIPLAEGEVVFDAYAFPNKWTPREIFLTIISLGIYWVMVARFRHCLKVVVVFFISCM